ncbi:hypothetical protein EYF80_057222 [Liparis tanakae]|uniref:Uncharacterized protein n=1 Tax=Liparis tanakae TaxID=230148 RepID=A0A4Z2EV01_9TELE|nr:hypothetical protein EYF80_057222 [Liparis tanakae]
MWTSAPGSCSMRLSLRSRLRRLLREPTEDGSALRQLPEQEDTEHVSRSTHLLLLLLLREQDTPTLQIERLQEAQIPDGLRELLQAIQNLNGGEPAEHLSVMKESWRSHEGVMEESWRSHGGVMEESEQRHPLPRVPSCRSTPEAPGRAGGTSLSLQAGT